MKGCGTCAPNLCKPPKSSLFLESESEENPALSPEPREATSIRSAGRRGCLAAAC